MYFISFAAIIFVTIIVTFSIPIQNLADMPSLLCILLICIPVLISSGLFKDFNNAFRIVLHKKRERSLIEIKRAAEAVNLVIKTVVYSGIFQFLLSLVVVLHRMDDPAHLGPILASAFLSSIYACGFALILLPLKSILKVQIIEFMPEQKEGQAQEEIIQQDQV